MATVVLQTVGAAIGSAVAGPVGAVIGRAAGALAGSAVDQKLFSKDQVVVGPRLDQTRLLTSTDGAAIPRVYGRNRLSGEIIWATRFEEVVSTARSSGKGGGANSTTTKTFSYFANFAIGICEGPISGIRRIWADSQELDLTNLEYRIYTGTENQSPDPLIEAKQGIENTPAYPGTAYIVFEDFPLEKYGNRIPQMSFEVIRSIGKLEKSIRSISVIPGATEYGYDPLLSSAGGGTEQYSAHNRHTSIADTDWKAAIDELQMVCPNLETVSLVVTWYGTDLRAGHCELKPGVTHYFNVAWSVAGLQRHQAHLVSQIEGRAAFGGTPTDASVLRAIADLKARGLKVILNPFIMMDIPEGNVLDWIDTETGQPVYPWRGVISCFPPPGETGTVDKTAVARNQVTAFASKYRSMILHYAQLCNQAGGVDGFLIGSEMRGLTRVRDQNVVFPFVETLVNLASDVRAVVGSDCMITYGADWSEYFGYQPVDGSEDAIFNLDPLWSSPNIDAIGIDNYMPTSDWRSDGDPAFPDVRSIYDLEYQKGNIASGEGHDWYYASDEDRSQRLRTPITDGQGEPWVFRYKDLVSWWSNPHYDRLNGVRQQQSTDWVPASKPIVFTELGCPAIDNGSNQPNVFYDPKSAQSAIPYFSSGNRDDLIQRRFLEAHYEFWDVAENNPLSPVYNKRMIDPALITPWAWDARPFPWFPIDTETWSDGENWHLGHWLNGRLGGCPVEDLIRQILLDYGFEEPKAKIDATFDGYIAPGAISARQAIEPLLGLLDIKAFEQSGKLVFQDVPYSRRWLIDDREVLFEENRPSTSGKRIPDTELPAEAVIQHISVFSGFEERATKSQRSSTGSDRQISLQAPVTMPDGVALAVADYKLRGAWSGRETVNISLSSRHNQICAGDVVRFSESDKKEWLVEAVETGTHQTLLLRSCDSSQRAFFSGKQEEGRISDQRNLGTPQAILMDLPLLADSNQGKVISHLAVSANPWGREYSVLSSPVNEGFSQRSSINQRAVIGKLLQSVPYGASGRWDNANNIYLSAQSGTFQSVDPIFVFNGSNLVALEKDNRAWELLQFRHAELQEDGAWRLSGLLRGQLGTEKEAEQIASVGAMVVLLDQSVVSLELETTERGIELNWRIGPSGYAISSDSYIQIPHTNNGRNRQMLSPVHLKAFEAENGDFRLAWLRRSRIDSDSWENPEIPIDAQEERYLLKILDENGAIKRQHVVYSSEFLYPVADQLSDFGTQLHDLTFEVAQISDSGVPGASSKSNLTIM